MKRPDKSEFEAAYLSYYIDLVQGGDVLKVLETQQTSTAKFIRLLTEEQGNHRYAPEKWSLKEVFGHVIDTERIFIYRLLCIARGEKQSLPGYEQNDYAAVSGYNNRNMSDIAEEYDAVRAATLTLIKHLSEDVMSNKGMANGKTITPRAIAFATAGHELHHINVIKTKYLQ